MLRSGNSNAECYTPREYRFTPCRATSGPRGQAPRHGSTEVTMETLTGPILYLLIVWGIITATFLALLLWRSILTTHEDDQLCIDAAGEHMAQEQRELIAKITRLSKPIATSGIAAGALLLLIPGKRLYEGRTNFEK